MSKRQAPVAGMLESCREGLSGPDRCGSLGLGADRSAGRQAPVGKVGRLQAAADWRGSLAQDNPDLLLAVGWAVVAARHHRLDLSELSESQALTSASP